jgi:hypothetical protein
MRMKRAVLAVLLGGALALTGCNGEAEETPPVEGDIGEDAETDTDLPATPPEEPAES